MKKTRRNKRKSCRDKVKHRTERDANFAILKTLDNNFVFHRMKAYKCKYCGMWHIGRTNKVVYSRFNQLVKKEIK